jgi:hypothetical protein
MRKAIMATTTMNLPRFGAQAQEFEDTRPTLYFSQHTWAHLNAVRRLSRSAAANDAVRPEEPAQAEAEAPAAEPIRDFTTAAWYDDEDDAAPAKLPPLTVPQVQGLELANLAGVAVVAVAALAAAGYLIG